MASGSSAERADHQTAEHDYDNAKVVIGPLLRLHFEMPSTGRQLSASIKTDSDVTTVSVSNAKHSGEHPVTMRSLLSPQLQPRPTTVASPAPSSPPATVASPPPSSPPAPASSPAPVSPSACSAPSLNSTLIATPSSSFRTTAPEDPAAEISTEEGNRVSYNRIS
ncbi:mucin-7-like [Homalodisca vitripennis]|uniref:mucin-7-like n=1 Tax=Homalodisca vitripennis TaxID=197043 RepID=UPI001EEB6BBC|nr:mucin-7-like [Homalodisca vitripennis]